MSVYKRDWYYSSQYQPLLHLFFSIRKYNKEWKKRYTMIQPFSCTIFLQYWNNVWKIQIFNNQQYSTLFKTNILSHFYSSEDNRAREKKVWLHCSRKNIFIDFVNYKYYFVSFIHSENNWNHFDNALYKKLWQDCTKGITCYCIAIILPNTIDRPILTYLAYRNNVIFLIVQFLLYPYTIIQLIYMVFLLPLYCFHYYYIPISW